jgi:hypothetical protein
MPEDVLSDDHVARSLWRVVVTLDLSAFTTGPRPWRATRGEA